MSDEKYKFLGLDTFMCLQKENVSIHGESGSLDFSLLYFNISLCNNATSPITCASTA